MTFGSVVFLFWRNSDKFFSSVRISATSARLFRKFTEHSFDSRPLNLALSLCCPLSHPLMPHGNVVPVLDKSAKLQWLLCMKKQPSEHWTLFQFFWVGCVNCEHIHLALACFLVTGYTMKIGCQGRSGSLLFPLLPPVPGPQSVINPLGARGFSLKSLILTNKFQKAIS